MKSTLLTLLAVLCIAAAPLSAQEQPPTADERERLEQRTDPGARAVGPGVGLTLTGTVVEFDEDQLVLQTTTGRQHIQLIDIEVPAGVRVGDRVAVDYNRTEQGVMIAREVRPFAAVDSEVRVETDPVAPAPATTQQTTVGVTTVTGTVVEITDTEIVLLTDRGRERFQLAQVRVPAGVTVGDRVTVDFTGTRGEVMTVREIRPVTVDVAVADPAPRPAVLPATGSSMPRLALFGFLALLGAVTLRALRS